jgi:hypothetical protein
MMSPIILVLLELRTKELHESDDNVNMNLLLTRLKDRKLCTIMYVQKLYFFSLHVVLLRIDGRGLKHTVSWELRCSELLRSE